NQCVEDGLQLERRAADDFEHVRSGGLLLQRLPQLVEQARVLDGDDRLLRKIADKLNLLLGERNRRPAVYAQGTYDAVVFEHWYDENRAGPCEIGQRSQLRIGLPVALGLLQIGNMDDLLRRNGPARTCFWIKGVRTTLPEFDKRG